MQKVTKLCGNHLLKVTFPKNLIMKLLMKGVVSNFSCL